MIQPMVQQRIKNFINSHRLRHLPGQSPNQGIARYSEGTLRRGRAIASHRAAKPNAQLSSLVAASAALWNLRNLWMALGFA
jgi:hypothetical protein